MRTGLTVRGLTPGAPVARDGRAVLPEYEQGRQAKLRGEDVKKSKLRSLPKGSEAHFAFIDGYNSVKKNGKPANPKA